MPDSPDLATAIELYAKKKLPYDRMRTQVQAQRKHVATAIAPLLAKVTKNGPRMMMLAQVLGVAGTPESMTLLLDAIERFEDELYVSYLKSQMDEPDDRSTTEWQPLRQRAIELLLHKNSYVRVSACHLLRALPGSDAVDRLLVCLESGDRSVRSAAIYAAAAQGDPRAIPALEMSAGSNDRYIAKSAYSALITLSGNRRVEFLRRGLGHSDLEMLYVAATALIHRPEPILIDDLRDALRRHVAGKPGMPICQLIRAMGKTGDERVAADLLGLFPGIDPYYVESLCVALGELRTRSAVPVLLPLLRDTDDHVRYAAAEALGRIGDPIVVPDLLAVPPSWSTGVALAAIGGDLVMTAIENLLSDESNREWAVTILGHMDEQRALDRLIALLGQSSLSLNVARALLCNPHPTAWHAALPIATAAPTEWREVSDNFLCANHNHLGLVQIAARRKALADLPPSTAVPPVDDPNDWSIFLPGTWTEVDDNTTRHVFTRDEQWFVYDGDGEVVYEGTWQESHDRTVGLWNGLSFPKLVRQDQSAVIDDPESEGPVILKRLSDSTDVPPVD